MKHLHKFYNKENIPWVQLVWNYYTDGPPHNYNLCGSFWWRDIMKLSDKYRDLCDVKVGKGDSVMFWHEKWNGQCPGKEYPRLFSYALDPSISIQKVLNTDDISTLFHRPMSVQAYSEMISLQGVMTTMQFETECNDS